MSLEIWKKVHRKPSSSNNLNKTSSLCRKVRKTSRRKRKRRRCGNGCSCTSIVNMNTTATATSIMMMATTATTAAPMTATRNTTMNMATGCPNRLTGNRTPTTATTKPCKISVNSKRKEKLQQICVNKLSKNISIKENQMEYNNNNDNNNKNKKYNTQSSATRQRGKSIQNKETSLSPATATKLLANTQTSTTCSMGNREETRGPSPLPGYENSRQHKHHCNKKAPEKCIKISNSQFVPPASIAATAACIASTNNIGESVPALASQVQRSAIANTSTPVTECRATCLSSYRSAGRLFPQPPSSWCRWSISTDTAPWPFSMHSFFCSRHPGHLQCGSTSASSSSSHPLPVRRNKLLRGLFMTLLVLSICHNKVLETSAISVRPSKGEYSSTTEAGGIPPLPFSPTTVRIATTKGNTSSAVMKGDQLQYPLQKLPKSRISEKDQPQTPSYNTSSQHPLTLDWGENEEAPFSVSNQPTGSDSELLPPKQKRQQPPAQRGQQLPQYLTSTQETSFSQNGMALQTTHNNTFQSMSIVDGRLTVPMDASQNQQQNEQQQLDYDQGNNGGGGNGGGGLSVDGNEMMPFPKRHSMPVFDFGMPRNITARTGHMEAVIKCRVDRLDDKSVSWIRKRDLHILTVGKTTYTSDKRFQVTESKDSREWTLHVKSPQARDTGIYECQVNTEPKMSMAFQLNIIEISPDAKAVITGQADLYFKVGSAIILTCLVHQPSVKDIGPIHWYRGEYLITPFDANEESTQHDSFGTSAALTSKSNTFDQHSDTDMYDGAPDDEEEHMSQILTNEITQEFTQRIAMEQQLCDTIKSRLRISNAQKSDSGNYTCQPTTASSASVMVHVINDENPAAMQKSGSASRRHSCASATGIIVYYLLCGCWWCWLLSSSSSSSSLSSLSSSLPSSAAMSLLLLLFSCLCHVIYKNALAGIDLIIEALQQLARTTLRLIVGQVTLSLVWPLGMLVLMLLMATEVVMVVKNLKQAVNMPPQKRVFYERHDFCRTKEFPMQIIQQQQQQTGPTKRIEKESANISLTLFQFASGTNAAATIIIIIITSTIIVIISSNNYESRNSVSNCAIIVAVIVKSSGMIAISRSSPRNNISGSRRNGNSSAFNSFSYSYIDNIISIYLITVNIKISLSVDDFNKGANNSNMNMNGSDSSNNTTNSNSSRNSMNTSSHVITSGAASNNRRSISSSSSNIVSLIPCTATDSINTCIRSYVCK